MEACLRAVEDAERETGRRALYVPNLIGTPDRMLRTARIRARRGRQGRAGLADDDGTPDARAARVAFRWPAALRPPALGGVSRVEAPALFGKLFRWFGADAVIFPHAGGRFSYSPETCRALAGALRARHACVKPAFPVAAGGIRVERVADLIGFYGVECVLLIGGSLYEAGDGLFDRTRALVRSGGEGVIGGGRMSEHVRQTEPFRWDGVEVKPYKGEGAHFSGITRQVLFDGGDGLGCQLRYFEIAARRLVVARAAPPCARGDDRPRALRGCWSATGSSRRAPTTSSACPRSPGTSFSAAGHEPLGFLCMVDCDRDVPERPDAAALAALRRDRRRSAMFIRA